MQARLGESLAVSLFGALCVFSLGSLASTCKSVGAAEFTYHHEQLLGTSMQIVVDVADETQARAVETTVLRSIDRLELIFSRYRSDSQFMQWQRGELALSQASPELSQVLQRAEYWRVASGGAFEIRAQALANLWKESSATQSHPSAAALQSIVEQLRLPPFAMRGQQIDSRLDNCPMSLDAIAKGYILDAVTEEIQREYPQVAAFFIMIGGDSRMVGNRAWNMAIANPLDATESSPPIARFQLQGNRAMATSGGYRRSFELQGKKISHILDPRTGYAAEALLSATVVAPTAIDADAAATALNVLGPVDGLAMIERSPNLACLLVLNSGDTVTSRRWSEVTQGNEAHGQSQSSTAVVRLVSFADEKVTQGLHVKFTLARGEGGRYRRPYVAVWLEDKDGFPVKTAVLWLQTDGPGPRWHRDLTRWWADDRMRKLAEDKELIGTISGATRGPGEYEARFDMTDNQGKPLPPGKYTLCLEAAREHGTHHLIREEIQLAAQPLAKKELKGGTEFSAATYTYQPVTAKSGGPVK